MDIGIIGCGCISQIIVNNLKSEFNFLYYYDLNQVKSKKLAQLSDGHYYNDYNDFIDVADLIIETASQEFLRDNILSILEKSDALVLSVGALLDKNLFRKVIKTSEKYKHTLHIPSGAIIGLDGLKAGMNNEISEIKLTTIKPPEALGLNVSKKESLFNGKASKAIELYPKNINVAASVSLACWRDIDVEIIADPEIDFNTHILDVKGEFGKFKTITSNKPSRCNPGTSELAALSAIEKLKNINNNISLGT